jgi:subfamily B ATP-binding cassette protein MsbA
MDAEETIKDLPDAKSISSFEGAIEYKKVCFSYEKAPVIRNIDMHITKGKTIALVGQSGGGKTTIANLLPRFYDLTEGDILIDGFSLKSYKLDDLRKLMGIVTQDSILFHDTVLNNIAFGVDVADEEDVMQAAKIANAHDFIMKLENGYATNIGDGGGKLSGGQRQRLSIARAILKNPPILILDEATSALDTESEKMVQEAIFNLMKNRTSIVIAHRLSTIKNADEILVIHEGAIVERGTHNELISQKGTYYKLYELQAFS